MESGTEVYGADSTYSIVTTGKEASVTSLASVENVLFNGDANDEVIAGISGYENVKIHFDGMMETEGVCVYTPSDESDSLAEFSVYASVGGENYEFVASYENTVNVGGRHYLTLPGKVYASDLKVVMKASGEEGIVLSEIEAYGKPATQGKVRMRTYEYDTKVPFVTDVNFIALDKSKTLNDGEDKVISTSAEYVSVIYSFDDFYQVEDVHISGTFGGMELLTSPDGSNYFSCGYFAEEDGEALAYGRAENNAKYAKLVFKRGEENIALSEIKLYARPVKSETKYVHDAMPVDARVTLKPNNIMYIDWSDYNGTENGVEEYRVYIEETPFYDVANLTPKGIYTGRDSNSTKKTAEQFATYAGLAPETTYYVAVAPANGETTVANPVKITTYGLDGGDNAAAIFGVNEYEGGSTSHIDSKEQINNYMTTTTWLGYKVTPYPDDNITQAEIDAILENPNDIANTRKLLGDLEVVQKNRHFNYANGNVKPYLSMGISWLPEGTGNAANIKRLNGLGVYTFGHTNEPEITATYNNQPEKFGKEFSQVIKDVNNTLKAASPESILYSPTLCGSSYYNYLTALYDNEPDMANLYDVCDVHMYSKGIGEPDEEYIIGAERTDVPERIFKKVERLENVLKAESDSKPIVSTEIGWTSSSYAEEETWGGVALETPHAKKAEFVARMFLSNIMAGTEEVYLYAFRNQGYLTNAEIESGAEYLDIREIDGRYYLKRVKPSHQHQYGIVDWYGNPLEGYYSFYTLGKILRDTYYVRAHELGTLVYGAEFYDRAKDMYVTALWEISGDGAEVSIASDDTSLKKVDMYGNVSYIAPGNLTLTTAPVYIYSGTQLNIY